MWVRALGPKPPYCSMFSLYALLTRRGPLPADALMPPGKSQEAMYVAGVGPSPRSEVPWKLGYASQPISSKSHRELHGLGCITQGYIVIVDCSRPSLARSASFLGKAATCLPE